MVDIYIPIDSSPAKNIIPPGEEIIYSTLCKIVQGSAPATTLRKWLSHVLLTNKGLVYTYPSNKAFYHDWADVRGIYFNKFIEISQSFKLFLKRDPNFETKEGFKKRKKEFGNKIKPIMNERKDEWVTKYPDKKERKKERRKRINEINHLK